MHGEFIIMKTIKILEENRYIRVFNPMYIKDIMMVSPDKNSLDWGVILNFNDGGSISKSFVSKDKADVFFKYVDECIKSIGK